MTKEKRPKNYRCLLNLPPDKLRPMTMEESRVLITLSMADDMALQRIKTAMAGSMGFQILSKRLEYYKVKADFKAVAWAASLCDRPGNCVM